MYTPLTNLHNFSLWTESLQNLLNKQIAIELHNFAVYERLYCFFAHGSVGYPNLARHFRHEADEELKHARFLMDYQLQRGGEVDKLTIGTVDIKSLETSSTKMVDAYKLVLELEKATYVSLHEIHTESADPHFQDLLESMLGEQLEGQKKINDTIQRLENGGPTAWYIHETIELKQDD